MKITCTQSDLSRALRAVARAVGNGKTHPILSGVMLRADGGSLQLTAYDLSIGIQTSIDAMVDTAGATVVPHRLLADITGRLDGTSVVSLTVDGDRVALATAGGSYSLSAAPADDFPDLPAVDAADGAVIDLAAPLAAVMVAASTDESKQVLTGIHLISDGKELRIEATDGHRLASRTLACNALDMDVVIPARAMAQVRNPASFAVSGGHVAIQLDTATRMITRTLDGTYPQVQQLIPATFKTLATCNREALLAALERIACVSPNDIVRLTVKAGAIEVTAESETSSGAESVACDGKLPQLAVNVHYLVDGLKGFTDTEVTIQANTSTSPVVIGQTYLVMPVQVRE
jgi:DNA polymerase-3 subunit beta